MGSVLITVEDLGTEAKEAAVREVVKLLLLPELLSSIASIKSDYLTWQQDKMYSKDVIVCRTTREHPCNCFLPRIDIRL